MDGHGHVIESDLNSPLFDFKFQLNKKKVYKERCQQLLSRMSQHNTVKL